MAKKKNQREAADKASEHARHGQSLALGDTGDGSGTGVKDGKQGMSNRPGEHGTDQPFTQAGAPDTAHHSRTSLDTTSESGRARDEGPDAIERTQPQSPKRDADATTSSEIEPGDRETL